MNNTSRISVTYSSLRGPVSYDPNEILPGARWWSVDFHTHTPASKDYGRNSDEAKSPPTPKEWLLAYMRAKIDCVAITDHNTGKWIDVLKRENESLGKEQPQG